MLRGITGGSSESEEPQRRGFFDALEDFNAIVNLRTPPSIARRKRERAAAKKNEIVVAGQVWDMTRKIDAHGRGLPTALQGDYFRGSARTISEQLPGPIGDAAAEILLFSADNAGFLAPGMDEMLDANPGERAIFEQNPEAWAKSLQQEGTKERLLSGWDQQQIPKVRQGISEASKWLQENNPEKFDEIRRNGINSMADLRSLNEELPEGATGNQLPGEYLGTDTSFGVIERNLDSFNDLFNTVEMKEEFQKAQAQKAGELSTRIAAGDTAKQREQRKELRKATEPVEREKQRASEIRLKIAEGGDVSLDERAFLDEVARLDPLTAYRREVIFGGSPAAKREALQESLSADPEAQGWTEVEPETDREKEIVRAGLGLIIERGEGDTKERSVYLPEEEVE
jgi:hypothetical protein